MSEGLCTFKKPILLLVLEYSSAMNAPFAPGISRWEATIDGVQAQLAADNGFLAANFILGVMRYAHDPDPQTQGTPIPGDTTELIDGFHIDVAVDGTGDPDQPFFECEGLDRVTEALAQLPPPAPGLGAWTRGGLESARAYIDQIFADHPDSSIPKRTAFLLLVTQGAWTDATGTQVLAPPDDPAPIAADAFSNLGLPTFVVGLGDAQGDQRAHQIAAAGGTGLAHLTFDQALHDGFQFIIQDLIDGIESPICTPGHPRVMVLLDASSRMLNLDGAKAPPGLGGWEQARAALAADGLFAADTDLGDLIDGMQVGLAVYGDATPAEERLLNQYGACHLDNIAWAIDPMTSCGPGCNDPFGPPPILWTSQDGSLVDPPGFDDPTLSHMPRCDSSGDPNQDGCFGSDGALHRGLQLVQDNLAAYKLACADPSASQPCDTNTTFLNLLISSGLFESPEADVQAALVAMHAAGVTTLVLGVGEHLDEPVAQANLAKLAEWGSGATQGPFTAATQAELAAELAGILDAINFDPCCKFNDCSAIVETITDDPPEPPPDPEGTTGESASDATTGEPTSGVTTADAITSPDTTSDATTSAGDTSTGHAATDPPTSSDPPPPGDTSDTGFTPTSDAGSASDTSSSSSDAADENPLVEHGCACASAPTELPWLLTLAPLLRRRVHSRRRR